jgi:hypothetical protein
MFSGVEEAVVKHCMLSGDIPHYLRLACLATSAKYLTQSPKACLCCADRGFSVKRRGKAMSESARTS